MIAYKEGDEYEKEQAESAGEFTGESQQPETQETL